MAYNNGLNLLPKMEMSQNQHFLTIEILDFSGNKIEKILTKNLQNVSAKVLRLDANLISQIGSFAFVGCKFLKL